MGQVCAKGGHFSGYATGASFPPGGSCKGAKAAPFAPRCACLRRWCPRDQCRQKFCSDGSANASTGGERFKVDGGQISASI